MNALWSMATRCPCMPGVLLCYHQHVTSPDVWGSVSQQVVGALVQVGFDVWFGWLIQ